jgi:hypothetical protein
MKKASSIIKNRVVSEDLTKWVDSYFSGQYVHPETRKDVIQALKTAGFSKGVPRVQNSLAMKVAHAIIKKTLPVIAEARVAAVVNATSACPRCGSAMVTVGLANGANGRYCSNVKCRVSAWVSE